MHVQFGDLEVARAVQHGSVPLSAGRLDVEPEANGGVSFEKGTGSSYSITACIAAGGATQTEAQQAADSVRLSIEGSRVRVQGVPRAKGSSVQLIIGTPPGADVRAATTNGPIGLRDVSGTFNRAGNQWSDRPVKRARHRLCACPERADRRRRQRG